jgi:hypothetical protein
MDYIILLLLILIFLVTIKRSENFKIPCVNVINRESIQNLKSIFSEEKIYYNNIKCSNLTTKNLHPKNYSGIIVAWSGTLDKIPIGWGLCDGTEYLNNFGKKIKSPDLRSRFIVGAWDKIDIQELSKPLLTPYLPKTIGGRETHKLTVDEIAPHSHGHRAIGGACKTYVDGLYLDGGIGCTLKSHDKVAPPRSDIFPDSLVNNKPHNNMPPYFALAYIIKL